MTHPYRVYRIDLSGPDILNCLTVPDEYRRLKDTRNGFYSKLEESILRDGFRNPVLVNAGFVPDVYHHLLPDEWRKDPAKILACVNLGGSRLWVAHQHKLTVPCIVSDFVGRFAGQGHEELVDPAAVIALHHDKPRWCNFGPKGVMTSQLLHTHLAP